MLSAYEIAHAMKYTTVYDGLFYIAVAVFHLICYNAFRGDMIERE